MNNIAWSGNFTPTVKKAIKKNPELAAKIERTLENLKTDIFHPSLYSHKLKGRLSGCWSCTVDYDNRIIFEINKTENNETEILLLSFGSHDAVY
ncbi:MAG: plasmid stabilization protein [Ignavibacteria bacterium GWB2_35_12]|nr:MAG: plasmid stabilization protein [Ignavibacteria bacterium GWA2_35_8]OGU38883.1 MAG: plasmid stabilization protein [Ignavibacteria bacterium GWB2_35_12]OGU85909.1 MAG: plasmid stabilization protein [Ignavibacteria bacterium RIFOXYA2_FULL_35_10]OGV20337.1 MAG: plasmid stabilization protein [Ignavibacteria bacterium RIFOXYC2_FULL_35_21]